MGASLFGHSFNIHVKIVLRSCFVNVPQNKQFITRTKQFNTTDHYGEISKCHTTLTIVFSFARNFIFRCTTCGEYIYKGKKFNARKVSTWKVISSGSKVLCYGTSV